MSAKQKSGVKRGARCPATEKHIQTVISDVVSALEFAKNGIGQKPCLSKHLANNPKLAAFLIDVDPQYFRMFSREIRSDMTVAAIAVTRDIAAFRWVSTPLREDPKFVHYAAYCAAEIGYPVKDIMKYAGKDIQKVLNVAKKKGDVDVNNVNNLLEFLGNFDVHRQKQDLDTKLPEKSNANNRPVKI